jgi:hypothetical protein
MDGMHYFWGWAWNWGSGPYTVSSHWEVPPLSAVVETSVVGFAEIDQNAYGLINITSAQYVDQYGVTRTDDLGPASAENPNPQTAIYYAKLVRFDWVLQVNNAWSNYIINVFEWGAYV